MSKTRPVTRRAAGKGSSSGQFFKAISTPATNTTAAVELAKPRTQGRSKPNPVLDITRQCIALFARVRFNQTLDVRFKADIGDQVGRFKIWAGTIGVFASGRASTDSRLAQDEDVKEIMIDLLYRLRRAIDSVLKPVIIEETPDDQASSDDSSDESEASLILSIGDDSSVTSEESKAEGHNTIALQDIDNTISRLYRLSSIIRKPASTQENSRIANYIEQHQEGPEATDFASHAQWQVKFRLPDASPEIVERLAKAVVFRKRKLDYRSRHQDKLSQGVETAFEDGLLLPTRPTPLQGRGSVIPRQQGSTLKSAATLKSVPNSIQLSGTEASTFNRRALASYSKSLAGGSNITKSAVARRDQLDVPPPPQSGETKEAICPYCFEVVDKAKMARPLWTRHILKDIDPYVCLFEGCNRPAEQFSSFEEWIMHMKWQHTLIWSCQAPSHGHLRFDNSEQCEAHMKSEHRQDMSMEQLALLVEKSAHPADDPFEAIVRYDKVASEERSVCPLCPWAVLKDQVHDSSKLEADPGELGDGMKQMRDHIAAHLESIALLSLPEQENIEDAASNEVQSQTARDSSRQNDSDEESLFHTSDAWNAHKAVRSQIEYLTNVTQEFFKQPGYVPESIPPLGEEEDWSFYIPKASTQPLDPGQDPVLLPFVEEARRRQVLEMQKRLGIPIIVISDTDGLEIPEAKWASHLGQSQSQAASTALLHNIGPSSPPDEQRKRRILEKRSDSFAVLDDVPSTTSDEARNVPRIVIGGSGDQDSDLQQYTDLSNL
ncbi:MAG: hypothetical protein Q9220_007537 [cf. Caloplaca sp. 1 TL-2023]